MKCKNCNYCYTYIGQPLGQEWCPVCGYVAQFEDFVEACSE